jgi:hypothetical protein
MALHPTSAEYRARTQSNTQTTALTHFSHSPYGSIANLYSCVALPDKLVLVT